VQCCIELQKEKEEVQQDSVGKVVSNIFDRGSCVAPTADLEEDLVGRIFEEAVAGQANSRYKQVTGDSIAMNMHRMVDRPSYGAKKKEQMARFCMLVMQVCMCIQVSFSALSLVGGFIFPKYFQSADPSDWVNLILNLKGGTGWLFLLGGVGTGTWLHMDWSGALNVAFRVEPKGKGQGKGKGHQTKKKRGNGGASSGQQEEPAGSTLPLAVWLFLRGRIDSIRAWNRMVAGQPVNGILQEETRNKLHKVECQEFKANQPLKKSKWTLPCLALPCLALPCLALPCLALPCLALPCLAL